jgi:DNA-binding CsgD family transcriptional regulator
MSISFKLNKWVFLLFIILLTSNVFCQDNSLIKDITFYKDDTNQLAIKDIKKKDFLNLKNELLGFNNSTFWFKISLKIPNKKESIFLDIKESSIKKIELFNQDSIITSIVNISENPNLSLEIVNPTNNLYYLKTTFNKQVYFNIQAKTKTDYYKSVNFTYFKFGWYYGLVLMVLLINLFFYNSLRDSIFLWYCFFLISINLGISTYDGALNFVFKDAVSLKYAIGIIYLLIPVSCTFFVINFLRVDLYWSKIKYAAFCLLFVQAALTITYFITNDFSYIAYGDNIALVIFLSSWILGLLLVRKQIFARYYVLGYSIILFTTILYTLSVNFGIQFFTVTLDHMKIGTVIEMFILTYAITIRLKSIQEENALNRKEISEFINKIYNLEDLLITGEEPRTETNEKIEQLILSAQLSEREAEILLLIASGKSNKKIAETLFISINTVKYHTRNLYEKLDINKRTEIAAKLV